jgi:hypothetical protein
MENLKVDSMLVRIKSRLSWTDKYYPPIIVLTGVVTAIGNLIPGLLLVAVGVTYFLDMRRIQVLLDTMGMMGDSSCEVNKALIVMRHAYKQKEKGLALTDKEAANLKLSETIADILGDVWEKPNEV